MVSFNFREWLEAAAQPCVIAATGAYNPVHRGHVKMFYYAKMWLSRNGYDVIAAYMIPRNYDYIQFKSKKKGETPEPDYHRQAMIQQALQGTFIKLLPLEKDRINMRHAEIRKVIESMHPGVPVFFIAGDDKMSCPPEEDTCLKDDPEWGKTVIIGRRLAGDASSTTVRTNLTHTGDEPNLLSPSNRKYVHRYGLWGARQEPVPSS